MLSGNGVITTWNGISDEGRLDFYQWHIHEHMPERISIPGFLRGRRYRASDENTFPEFFTLYEVEEFAVLKSEQYLARLNAPTPWTRRATAYFQNTSRGLGHVIFSTGPGPGGALATIRFNSTQSDKETSKNLSARLADLSKGPLLCGLHLCRADEEASQVKTEESKGRTDISTPPKWVILLEGCTTDSLSHPTSALLDQQYVTDAIVGRYLLEYVRGG